MSNIPDREVKIIETNILADWKAKVLARDHGACVNCEKTSRVAACFVIPSEAGGRIRIENGVSLCRECRIAAEGARVLPLRIDNKTPINFLISNKLHDTIEKFAHNGSKFGSISALVRHMISSFITEPEMYEDIGMWQDFGSGVKINGWVDGSIYLTFKAMCQDRGMSYTDTLKSLLLVAVDGYEQK